MTDGLDGDAAVRIGKLVTDLDSWIRALRACMRQDKPWQRNLSALVDDADAQMQVLMMTAAMDKADKIISGAAIDLARACSRVDLAIQGSRADAVVRTSTHAIATASNELRRLIFEMAEVGSPSQ